MSKDKDEEFEPATVEMLLKREPTRSKCVIELGDGVKRTIVFEAMGRDAFEDLLDAHTPDNDDGTKDGMSENVETFGPALIAECAIAPEMTHEQVLDIWDSWNRTELNMLYRTALEANTKSAVNRLGED